MTLRRARDIALRNGVRYAYVGNVVDRSGESTYCHVCNRLLIGRDWYQLTEWRLMADGRCPQCKTPLAGEFESQPGTWGPRRMPVRLADFREGGQN